MLKSNLSTAPEKYEIGDTLFLNSIEGGRKQLIVVDILEPRSIKGIRLGEDFVTWDYKIYMDSISAQLKANSKVLKHVATPLRYGERTLETRYVIVDEIHSASERVLPHRILEPTPSAGVGPYYTFQGSQRERYRVAKVGSLYEWDLDELLTHNHNEVRQIAIDWMNGKTWTVKPIPPPR